MLLKGSGTVLAQPERNSMDSKNILGNEEAMAILNDTATRLRAIGVHCMVSPMSLPQGMSVSLHAGATEDAATAAEVAAERGGEYAHAVDTHTKFARMVELAIADAADVEASVARLISD